MDSRTLSFDDLPDEMREHIMWRAHDWGKSVEEVMLDLLKLGIDSDE